MVDGPDGRFSWFYQNSASAIDLNVPIVVGGTDYGAPIDNLEAALKAEGLNQSTCGLAPADGRSRNSCFP